MHDMGEFRVELFNQLKDVNANFENYVTSQLYLNDVVAEENVTLEFLISKGIEFIEHDLRLLGISIDTSIYENYVDMKHLVDIYTLIQPKNFKEVIDNLPKDSKTSFIKFINTIEEDDDFINDFLEWLTTNVSQEGYIELKKLSESYITSNNTFRIYIKKLIDKFISITSDTDNHESNLSIDDDQDILNLKLWNQTILHISSSIYQIEQYEDFQYKDNVINVLKKWIYSLSRNNFIELALWYISLLNQPSSSDDETQDQDTDQLLIFQNNPYYKKKLSILKDKYLSFRKVTEGYPEYYKEHYPEISNTLVDIIYEYITKLDPFIDLMENKKE